MEPPKDNSNVKDFRGSADVVDPETTSATMCAPRKSNSGIDVGIRFIIFFYACAFVVVHFTLGLRGNA